MIPILFDESATTFTTNGLGRLADAISCIVTEERNGKYELEMEYPVTGIRYDDIRISRIIYAVPADGKGEQPFQIYRMDKMINGRVKIYAEHITYRANHIPVMPFEASTCSEAMALLSSNAAVSNPFSLWTDINKAGDYKQEVPEGMRARLGGQDGSILDLYGGEYEWDHFTIKLHASRGYDNGVTLRYGKNITDLTQEHNITTTYTAVCPYYRASEDDELITLPEKYIASEAADQYPYPLIKTVDMADQFEDDEEVTVAKLRQKTREYIAKNSIGVPMVSIKVSFVALWQTEEYKSIAPLERVNLCDTVTVIFEKLGVSAKAKVIKTVYNVLLDRYDSIEIGETKATMSTTVANQISQMETEFTSHMQKAIKHATDLISGGLGGYVVLKRNANGKPEEILIMDTPNMETAKKVIRMNLSGIGFSKNGYNGPFETAWTIDGHFVADFIDTGTLTANIIKAGILTDEAGKFMLNMVTGALRMKDGTFSGTITASDISGGTITGSTIQTASSGRRMVMDSTTSLRGKNGNTTDNIINMEQNVSGTNAMIIDAKNRIDIRTPKLYIGTASYGESSGTVYQAQTTGYDVMNSITKVYEGEKSDVKEGNVKVGDNDVYCTLPVYLKPSYSTQTFKHGILTDRKTKSGSIF